MNRWLIGRSAELIGSPEAAAERLGHDQLWRWRRLRRPTDRCDFLAARAVAARLVGDVLGTDAAQVRLEQRCERCSGPHGVPRVVSAPGLSVSWSHADGWVAAAVSDRPVGIDLEVVRDRPVPASMLASVLTDDERDELSTLEPGVAQASAFARLWVRKEAVLKATGTGLAQPPGPAAVDVRNDQAIVGGRTWRITDLSAPVGTLASLAEPDWTAGQ